MVNYDYNPAEELQAVIAAYRRKMVTFAYTVEDKIAAMERFLRMLLKYPKQSFFIGMDCETTGLDPFAGRTYRHDTRTGEDVPCPGSRVFGTVLALPKEPAFVENLLVPLDIVWCRIEEEEYEWVRQIINHPRVEMVGHNIKFDVQLCHYTGIETTRRIHDTLVMSRLTHDRDRSHSLKWFGLKFSGYEPSDTDSWEKDLKEWLKRERSQYTRMKYPKGYINYSHVPPNMMRDYAWADAFYGWIVFARLYPEMMETYWDVYSKIEMPVTQMAIDMERRGVRIDRRSTRKHRNTMQERSNVLLSSLKRLGRKHRLVDFNPNSPQQVRRLLVSAGVPEHELTDKDVNSCNKTVLIKAAKKYKEMTFIAELLDLRSYAKLGGTYFNVFLERSDEFGILHCQLRPSDTANGRFACVQPNLQNIPRPVHENKLTSSETPNPVRSVFVPRDGYANWYHDYSQVELRGFAVLCGETSMLAAFDRGEDIHMFVAREILGKETKLGRFQAKAVNFGIIYGLGVKGLALQLETTFDRAKSLYTLYKDRFPGVSALMRKCAHQLRTRGYVEDLLGRRYHIPYEKAYIAVNAVVQGMCATILKIAMINVQKYIDTLLLNINVLLQVHDELVTEIPICPEEYTIAKRIKTIMEDIPVVRAKGMMPYVDAARSVTNWADKQGVKL